MNRNKRVRRLGTAVMASVLATAACSSEATGPALTGGDGPVAGVSVSAVFLGAVPLTWDATGHSYEAIAVPEGITWIDAEAAATASLLGDCSGYLATLTSAEENAFLVGNLPEALPAGDRGFWIGGLQTPGSAEPAGGWSWVTGEAFTYTNWKGGEPNDFIRPEFPDGEDAIHLADDGGGTWNDLPASDVTPGYVVEYDAGCATDVTAVTDVPVGLKPGNGAGPRPVNLKSRGVLAVAVFSTQTSAGEPADFDASDIDPESVTLGDDDGDDTPVARRGRDRPMANGVDMDGDGDVDMLLHFRTQELVANGDLGPASVELVLRGETMGGTAFRGSDAVRIVP